MKNKRNYGLNMNESQLDWLRIKLCDQKWLLKKDQNWLINAVTEHYYSFPPISTIHHIRERILMRTIIIEECELIMNISRENEQIL